MNPVGESATEEIFEAIKAQAPAVARRLIARADAAQKQLSTHDRHLIERAVMRTMALELGGDGSEGDRIEALHWRTVLFAYDFVTRDILKEVLVEAGKDVLLVVVKILARGFGIPL